MRFQILSGNSAQADTHRQTAHTLYTDIGTDPQPHATLLGGLPAG